jgi:hypothetical protein
MPIIVYVSDFVALGYYIAVFTRYFKMDGTSSGLLYRYSHKMLMRSISWAEIH